jgi:transglutaminase-like putative cysteine protease
MFFRIEHLTRYSYEQPATRSFNHVRLAPIDAPDQKRIRFALEVTPLTEISEYRDNFGNLVHTVNIEPPHTELVIKSTSTVERLALASQPSPGVTIRDYLANDSIRTEQYKEFLSPTRYIPFSSRMRSFFWSVHPQMSEDVADYAERMIHYVHGQFAYDGSTTHVHSTVDDILTKGGGVCQDFAHLSIGLFRLAGIPARYVSGYLAPDPSLTVAARSASHAWIEALLPGCGWTGFDPTHRTRTIIRHIRVAIGRDFNDLPMVSGVYESAGGDRRMTYDLKVNVASENFDEFKD